MFGVAFRDDGEGDALVGDYQRAAAVVDCSVIKREGDGVVVRKEMAVNDRSLECRKFDVDAFCFCLWGPDRDFIVGKGAPTC